MAKPSRIAHCGTRSGYNRHLRLKNQPCDLCKEANRVWVAQWTAKNPERIKEINEKARTKYRSRPEIQKQRKIKGREYSYTENGREASIRAKHRRRARKMSAHAEKYTA